MVRGGSTVTAQLFERAWVEVSANIRRSRKRISRHAWIFEGECHHGEFGPQPVVVKFVQADGAKEIQILKKLRHRNVVRLIESDRSQDEILNYHYLALEKCHDKNLGQLIRGHRDSNYPFHLRYWWNITKQIISGVAYIHGMKIIHKDLKPENILITSDEQTIKIADFGISEELQAIDETKSSRSKFGTVGYRPPESFESGTISLKSDIFSLGVVICFTLSYGGNPFGDDDTKLDHNIKNSIVVFPKLFVQNNETTEHLIRCMIRFELDDRPTIGEVLEHPCWTGREVKCNFDYRCSRKPKALKANIRKRPMIFKVGPDKEHYEIKRIRRNWHSISDREHPQPNNAVQVQNINVGGNAVFGGSQHHVGCSQRPQSSITGAQYHSAKLKEGTEPHRKVLRLGSVDLFQDQLLATSNDCKVYAGEVRGSYGEKESVAIKAIFFPEEVNLREAENLKIMKTNPHQNVVAIREIARDEHLFIVMELCSTLNLAIYLNGRRKNNIPMNLSQALDFSRQIIDGLQYIHSYDILHRDLKPSSALVSECQRYLRICDFGLSKKLKNGRSVTKLSRRSIFDDSYRAPETYVRDKITKEADIFSSGLILHHLLSYGFHPYGDDPTLWQHNIKNGKGLNLSHLRFPFREKATVLLSKMLENNPALRPTIEEIKDDPIFTFDWLQALLQNFTRIWQGAMKDVKGKTWLDCVLYKSEKSPPVEIHDGNRIEMKFTSWFDIASLKKVTDEEPSGYFVAEKKKEQTQKLVRQLVESNQIVWIGKEGWETGLFILLCHKDYPELFGFFLPNREAVDALLQQIEDMPNVQVEGERAVTKKREVEDAHVVRCKKEAVARSRARPQPPALPSDDRSTAPVLGGENEHKRPKSQQVSQNPIQVTKHPVHQSEPRPSSLEWTPTKSNSDLIPWWTLTAEEIDCLEQPKVLKANIGKRPMIFKVGCDEEVYEMKQRIRNWHSISEIKISSQKGSFKETSIARIPSASANSSSHKNEDSTAGNVASSSKGATKAISQLEEDFPLQSSDDRTTHGEPSTSVESILRTEQTFSKISNEMLHGVVVTEDNEPEESSQEIDPIHEFDTLGQQSVQPSSSVDKEYLDFLEKSFCAACLTTAYKKETITPQGGSISLHGCELIFSEGEVDTDEVFELSVDNNPNLYPKSVMPVSLIIGCKPSKFRKPVKVRLASWFRSEDGQDIKVIMFSRSASKSDWEAIGEATLTKSGFIDFEVLHFCKIGMGVLHDKAKKGLNHYHNDVWMHREKGYILSYLCHDQKSIDQWKKELVSDFRRIIALPYEMLIPINGSIHMSISCVIPQKMEMEPDSSFPFTITEEVVKLNKLAFYFRPKPHPSKLNHTNLYDLNYAVEVKDSQGIRVETANRSIPLDYKWQRPASCSGQANQPTTSGLSRKRKKHQIGKKGHLMEAKRKFQKEDKMLSQSQERAKHGRSRSSNRNNQRGPTINVFSYQQYDARNIMAQNYAEDQAKLSIDQINSKNQLRSSHSREEHNVISTSDDEGLTDESDEGLTDESDD